MFGSDGRYDLIEQYLEANELTEERKREILKLDVRICFST